MATRHCLTPSVLGDLLLIAKGRALTGLYFEQHAYPPPKDTLGEPVEEGADPLLAQAAAEVREYLSGERREFSIPFRAPGDETSRRVWEMLLEIPYGETTTYGALALRLGNINLAQRVGAAVGHNPISIVIPCHRVLGADGSLTGFAGGLDRKRALLALEEPEPASAGRLF